ncbi:MAG: FAD-binding protein [Faecalibacterium prausnitzii]
MRTARAQTFFGCFGTKLLKDSDGRVTGVIIRDAQNDNKYIQLNASKGVILATGDNSGDEKIMKHFAPEIVEKKIANMGAMGMLGVDVEGKTVETGDGLRMGAWIGAKVQDFHAPMTHHMGSGMGVTPFLQINKRGDRFMNECIPGQQLENQIELQNPSAPPSSCTTPSGAKRCPTCPQTTAACATIIPEDEDEPNPNYTDRQYTKISAKAEAYQFKADTLEDLLTQCGFEGDALDNALASVERYNELAKAGSDDDFGKPASRMFALENPPYYACQWGTTSHAGVRGRPGERRELPHLHRGGPRQPQARHHQGPVCLRQCAGQPLRSGIPHLHARHQPQPVRLLRLHRRQELRGRCLIPC